MSATKNSIKRIHLELSELYEDFQHDDLALSIILKMNNLLIDLKKYEISRDKYIRKLLNIAERVERIV